MFETTLVGNQPKIFDDPARPNLRLARNRFDKKALSAEELEEVTRATIQATIADQIDAGLDRVTDGRIRWDDPVTPFAAAHDGFAIGGLIRYFDNNVYYRRPTIDGPVRFVRSAVAEDFRLARRMTDRPLLASVCGPYSLAKFCTDQNSSDGALLTDCARLVRGELEALAAAGADWVQLDEPFLGRTPSEIHRAVETIAAATRNVGVKTFVYIYFTNIAPIIDRLWDLPVDAIGADCATAPGNFEALLHGPRHRGRGLGIVDARTTRLETTERLTATLDRLIAAGAADWPSCFITPSAGLEFLPHKNAMAKMRRLCESVRQVTGAVAVG